MPPDRSGSTSNIEGRFELAINAIRSKKIASINEAARVFSIPRSTLAARIKGRQPRAELRPNCKKLTETEEESLKKWILSLDQQGASPRIQ